MLRHLAVTCALGGAVAGCGAAAPSPATHAAPLTAAACRRTDADELLAIGRRIYAQAAGGPNVASVRRRLAHSGALARAVTAEDPRATASILRRLSKHQITRIVVWGPDGRALARLGRTPALAPATGTIDLVFGLPVGRYAVAVAGDAAIAGEIRSVTGAPTRIMPAGATAAPTARTFAATAFPAGPLQIAMMLPPSLTTACAATPSQTRLAVIRQVGLRLLAAERAGRQPRRVLRHVARDRGFGAAVAARDPARLRAAIIRFFQTRSLHVVRIRATTPSGALIGDVGGPYVISPLTGRVASAVGHRLLGRVTLSIQDDTGYMKLMHRFTGALVVVRAGHRLVPGSAHLPKAITRAQATTLRGTAFPGGRLRITLALPQRATGPQVAHAGVPAAELQRLRAAMAQVRAAANATHSA
jgi:hypothetical protein